MMTTPHIPLTYRPDIDGLRAVAVISVILFHLGVGLFSGGFVGVDVFFVISGFLITSIIEKEITQQRFSFLTFWERRIRRIIPALSVMILSTLVAGWFLFLPNDYKRLAQQALSQTVFSSNILFYLQSGYFDTANDTKPLLHTWSLAVEEQFYFFFPLILFILTKYFLKARAWIVGGVMAVSFALSIYGVSHHPTGTFYLLPTRAWELLIGAMLVFIPTPKTPRPYIFTCISFTAMTMVFVPFFIYDRLTPFPGLAAFPPCLGAALILWSGKFYASFIHRVLAVKPCIFIGKISYSWYLWHWPIIVFYKYTSFSPLSAYEMTGLFFASMIISIVSWRIVEHPFRQSTTSKKAVVQSAIMSGMMILAFAIPIREAAGFPLRFTDDVLLYETAEHDKNPLQNTCNKPSLQNIKANKLCQTNQDVAMPTFLVWGDSHADAVAPAFYELSEKLHLNGYIATYDGCPPILGVDQTGRDDSFYCIEFNNAILALLDRKSIHTVFLISSWSNWLTNPRLYTGNSQPRLTVKNDKRQFNTDVAHKLVETMTTLGQKGIHVVVMQTIPMADFDPPHTLALRATTENGKAPPVAIPLHEYNHQRESLDATFKMMASTASITLLDPKNILCGETMCNVSHDGKSLYYNGGHLSTYGARYLEPLFEKILRDTGSRGLSKT